MSLERAKMDEGSTNEVGYRRGASRPCACPGTPIYERGDLATDSIHGTQTLSRMYDAVRVFRHEHHRIQDSRHGSRRDDCRQTRQCYWSLKMDTQGQTSGVDDAIGSSEVVEKLGRRVSIVWDHCDQASIRGGGSRR